MAKRKFPIESAGQDVALRRRTRIILIVVAVPLVVFVSLVLFLNFYFTSERLKALVVPRLQAALNREVSINAIGLSFLPGLGVKIEGLRIANREGPGFSEQPLAYLDEFRLNVKLLPLLGGRLEVNHLSFNKPTILLEINRDGEANFAQPKAADRKEPGEEGLRIRTDEKGSLLLSNFEIKEGELAYRNQKEDRIIKAQGIGLIFRMESLPEVKELRTESDLKIARFTYGAIEKSFVKDLSIGVKQKSKIIYQKDRLTIEDGSIEIQSPRASDVNDLSTTLRVDRPVGTRRESLRAGQAGLKFRTGGSMLLVDDMPASVDFSIASDNLDLKQILSLLPERLVKGTENPDVEGIARIDARIQGEIGEGKQPTLSVHWTLTNGKIQYAKLPKAITDVNLRGSLSSTEAVSKLEISDFSAMLGSNPIKMKMAVNNLSDPYLDANLEGVLNLSEVKDFYPVEAGKELSGLVRAKFLLKGKMTTLTGLKGSGTLELQNVTVAGGEKPIRNLSGFVSLNNEILESKRLTMQYGESDLSVSFTLRDYLTLLFSSKHAGEKGKPPKPSMRTSISSRYFESTPSREPIVLPPFDVNATIGISRFVYKGATPFECTDLRGNISSSENVVQLKGLSFRSLDGTMSATGTFDLRNKERPAFNLNVGVKDVDAHSFLRRFSSFGEHLFGKISLSVNLKGELDDTLGFNTKSLSGDGNVNVVDGKLAGYPVMQRLATFLELPDMREPSFKTWSNSFKIFDGRIGLPDVRIAASGNDLLLAGWHGFDGTLDYALTIKLSQELSNQFSGKSVAQQLGNLFKDGEGRVTLFLLVGGTTENPKFRWDTKAAQERLREKVTSELEKKKEEVREKAKEELQKKLDEGKDKLKERLKKLLKKP